MKKLLRSDNLPVMTAALGGIGLVLRKLLYALAVDEKNLLVTSHPLELLLWLLTAASLLLIVSTVWRLDGSNRYVDNFRPSVGAAAGHILAAAGILLTVVANAPMMPGHLGMIWKVLGILAVPCLVLAGLARMQGRRPFFALHLVPCLFLVFHTVDHYQSWSGNPQFQDYAFALFGTMALTLFAFYNAAFDVGSGRRRMLLGMGLSAVYLCLVELAVTEYPFLYLGGIVWVLTGLCSLKPRRSGGEV